MTSFDSGTIATGHGVHFGRTSNYYGNPDHVHGVPSHALVGYIDVNQKLDCLIDLMQNLETIY